MDKKKIRIGIEIPIYSDIHSLITSQARSSQSVSYLRTKKGQGKKRKRKRKGRRGGIKHGFLSTPRSNRRY